MRLMQQKKTRNKLKFFGLIRWILVTFADSVLRCQSCAKPKFNEHRT